MDAAADEPFPGFDAQCGMPIVTLPTPNGAAAFLDGRGAPFIQIDPNLMGAAARAERTFLLAHECAHHRLGHTSRQGLLLRARGARDVADQELSADCWAAESLARAGLIEVVRQMADRFHRLGPTSPGQGYPSGIQRSLILRQCGQAGLAPPLPTPAPSP